MAANAHTDFYDPTVLPETIINRDEEQRAILSHFTPLDTSNLYLHGHRGLGKTLVARHVLENLPDDTTGLYVPCTKYDTQYKVLQNLNTLLTDEELNDGFHSAQLKERIRNQIETDTVIVLDDLEFVLENDGNSLLYFLSRLEQSVDLSIMAISAFYTDLNQVIDERTYSSLLPRSIQFDSYSIEQATSILWNRARAAFSDQFIQRETIEYIASQTTNIRFGLCWLEQAVVESGDLVLEEHARTVRTQAIQRHQDVLLKDFSSHHHVLLEAINQLDAEESGSIRTGVVYDRYKDICGGIGKEILSARRVSDLLKHLELLDIIDVTYHRGGKWGKTREIRLRRQY